MESIRKVCENAWCKAIFFFKEIDMIESDDTGELIKLEPPYCPKCKSFDKELSGGINWEERQYEDDIFTGQSFPIKYKVTNYKS